MRFHKHPSSELVELFHHRPFQGQSPEQASIIFLSSDANYSPEISGHSFFKRILEYHANGVSFWKRQGCHHPFLLPDYPFNKNTGGVPFHRNFSKLGLGPEHAEHISFLELIDVPTIGNKSEDREQYHKLLNSSSSHHEYLSRLITGGEHKLFFVSGGVLNDMRKIPRSSSLFPWLNEESEHACWSTNSLHGNIVNKSYHFSSSQIHGQLTRIRTEIDHWLERNKAISEAVEKHGYRQREVADHLGMYFTSISRIVKQKR